MDQPVQRKNLLTAIIDGKKQVAEVEIQEVTLNVGVDAPLHSHPCPTMGIVTEGKIAFQIAGKDVQHLVAGDAFYEPAHVKILKFDNEGDVPAKFAVFYLLSEGETETIQMLKQ